VSKRRKQPHSAVYLLVVVATFATSNVVASETEKSLNEYASDGYKLITAKRFSNAEIPLRKAVEHRDASRLSMQTKLQLTGLLESSLMYQNKYKEVHEVLSGKLDIMEASGMKPSFDYATSMLNVAESLFYMGQKRKAIETTQSSIAMMKSLPKVNTQVIAFAEANIAQYKANRVQAEPIYKDLSEFFTLCESISAGTPIRKVQQMFSNNLEVGRNYAPKGIMSEIFATAIPAGFNKDSFGNMQRTIFIPDANHASDWCIVYKEDDRVKLTIVAPD